MTENTQPAGRKTAQSRCPACDERPPTPGRRGLCSRCYDRQWAASNPEANKRYQRKYRSDPEKLERSREGSRRWKREHLGQPGRPKDSS